MAAPRWDRRRLLVVLLVLVVVAGLAVGGGVLWKRLHRSALDQALHSVPASSLRVAYTDWEQVRTRLRADLGAKPGERAVSDFMAKAYDTDFAAVSSIDESAVALQKLYGFSPATAQWEAFAQGRSGATMVLKMPEADFDDLAGNLRSLGYRKPKDENGVWNGGADLVAQIDPTITPELQFVVLLADDRLVVTSDNPDYAAVAADVARGDGASLAGRSASPVEGLARPANAMLWVGDFACSDLAMSSADQSDQDLAERLVQDVGGVDPLSGLAMAMYGDRSLHVVESFEDSDRARRNLRPRAKLAVGEAVGRGGSFSDDLRLTSSKAVGSTVRLVLEPKTRTGYVLSAIYSGPLLFATC